MKNGSPFHAPLHEKDTQTQTFGCRYTNPDICRKNMMPDVCAFARSDNICLSPPASWRKQYAKLLEQQRNEKLQEQEQELLQE